jgi:helicase
LLRNFEIHTYAGDIFSWLDSLIRMLEAIQRIADAHKEHKIVNRVNNLIKGIEN